MPHFGGVGEYIPHICSNSPIYSVNLRKNAAISGILTYKNPLMNPQRFIGE
jgi:hypothetical protein